MVEMLEDKQMTDTDLSSASKKNADEGSIGAALLAAGIGCMTLGIVTTLSEAVKAVADRLNLYNPVGPLSGKSLAAIVVWLVAWACLARNIRGKQINIGRWLTITGVCVAIGLLMSFPPFFDMLGDK